MPTSILALFCCTAALLVGLKQYNESTKQYTYTYISAQLFIIRGVQEKLCFFTIHCKCCNPSLAYIVVRNRQSSKHNASAQSLLLAGNFLYNQQQPSAVEGEVVNFKKSWQKNPQYLMNTLYIKTIRSLNRNQIILQNDMFYRFSLLSVCYPFSISYLKYTSAICFGFWLCRSQFVHQK